MPWERENSKPKVSNTSIVPDPRAFDFRVAVDSVVGSNLPQTNQTNLAIKGVLGISAMAKISDAVGMGDDATRYGVCFQTILFFIGAMMYYTDDPFVIVVHRIQAEGCWMSGSHSHFLVTGPVYSRTSIRNLVASCCTIYLRISC